MTHAAQVIFIFFKKNQWLFMAPAPKVSNTESDAETYKFKSIALLSARHFWFGR